MSAMKTKLLAALFAGLLATAGRVNTVTGDKTGGCRLSRISLKVAYQLPPDVIFAAAKEVIREDGV